MFSYNDTVHIAIFDSGIDSNHSDINCMLSNDINSSKRVAAEYIPSGVPNYVDTAFSDVVGHGTQVAGVVGSVISNSINENNTDIIGMISSLKIMNYSPDNYQY